MFGVDWASYSVPVERAARAEFGERIWLFTPDSGVLFMCMLVGVDDTDMSCGMSYNLGLNWERLNEDVANVRYYRTDTKTLYGLAQVCVEWFKSTLVWPNIEYLLYSEHTQNLIEPRERVRGIMLFLEILNLYLPGLAQDRLTQLKSVNLGVTWSTITVEEYEAATQFGSPAGALVNATKLAFDQGYDTPANMQATCGWVFGGTNFSGTLTFYFSYYSPSFFLIEIWEIY